MTHECKYKCPQYGADKHLVLCNAGQTHLCFDKLSLADFHVCKKYLQGPEYTGPERRHASHDTSGKLREMIGCSDVCVSGEEVHCSRCSPSADNSCPNRHLSNPEVCLAPLKLIASGKHTREQIEDARRGK